MNQRPLGYEPNELPDCSTPQADSMRGPLLCQGLSPAKEVNRQDAKNSKPNLGWIMKGLLAEPRP